MFFIIPYCMDCTTFYQWRPFGVGARSFLTCPHRLSTFSVAHLDTSGFTCTFPSREAPFLLELGLALKLRSGHEFHSLLLERHCLQVLSKDLEHTRTHAHTYTHQCVYGAVIAPGYSTALLLPST